LKTAAILWIFLSAHVHAQTPATPPPVVAPKPAAKPKQVAKPKAKPTAKLPVKATTPAPAPAPPAVPKTAKERRNIDLNRSVRIEYKEPSWNKSKTQVETASVIVKDANTSRMVRVQLSETEADSGIYAGIYSISWKEIQNASPEIYAVPPDQIDKKIDVSKLNQLKRLPYIFKKDDKNQLIEAFSTREEANRALEAYKAEQDAKLKKSEEISEALIETVEKSQKAQDEIKRKDEDRLREEGRLKALSDQERKIDQAVAAFKALSAAEQANRKKKAAAIAKEAMAFYMGNKFLEAEQKFRAAFEADPTLGETYFYYGVTLYKLDKFNESIVFLTIAPPGKYNPNEREFLKGLNHYRLNEQEKAFAIFEALKKSSDPVFGPNASFYQGLVKMKMEKWDEAKNHFQDVLDTSKDPALDQSAEDNIEKIEKIKQNIALKSKKIFLTGSLGMQYDSNVLLVNSSSPNSGDPSRIGDNRYVTGASVEYRPLYEDNHEFSVKGKGDLIYSSKGDNVSADPLMYVLMASYKYKGLLWGKGYKLEVHPEYRLLNLDIDRTGATGGYFSSFSEKENYLGVVGIGMKNNFVMKDTHIMGINLWVANGTALNSSASGANDSTGIAKQLDWENIFFLSPKKDLFFMGKITYFDLKANGSSLTNTRYAASGMLGFPLPYEFQGIGGLSYAMVNYPDKTPQTRDDKEAIATFMLARPVLPWLKGSLVASYTDNKSNLDANTYNKYLIMTVFTANWSF
jgi:hypothetical protein